MTKVNTSKIVILIIILASIGQFASDSYIPSLPAITYYFNTNSIIVKQALTIYLLGLVLSQLIYGPLSDSYGRKKILFSGYLIFFIASFFAVLSHKIEVFLFARLMQGAGIGCTNVLFKSMIRDIASGKRFAKLASCLTIVMAVTPVMAPIVGGYVQYYHGWQANFLLLTFLSFLALIITALYIPETILLSQRHDLNLKVIALNYKALLSEKLFIRRAIFTGLTLSIYMIYLLNSSFIFQEKLHYSSVKFGWILACSSIATLLGGILNFLLLSHYTLKKIIGLALFIMLFSCALLLAFVHAMFIDNYCFFVVIWFLFVGASLAVINVMSLAFEDVKMNYGTASAFYNCIQCFVILAVCAAASSFYNNSILILSMLISTIVVFLFFIDI